jgi:uncharacterized RDD family membrane protein YckC
MSQLVINTSFNIELGFEIAPIHKRIFAVFIDLFVMYVYYKVVSIIFVGSIIKFYEKDFENLYFYDFLIFIPITFYPLLSEVLLKGESIGKRLMGLRLISLDGNTPTLSQYAIRWFLWPIDIVSSLGIIAFLSIIITKNGQRLGDLAAGTTLVSKKLPYSIDQTIFKAVSVDTYKVCYPQVMRLSDRDLNTINNILQQHKNSNVSQYIDTIAQKVKTVLEIESEYDSVWFLETLLNDYNYLSQK